MTVTNVCSRCGGYGLRYDGEAIVSCSVCGGGGTVWPARCNQCGSFATMGKPCKRCGA